MARARRITRISTGIALLFAGTAMLVLPGPGLLAMAGGLALLRRDMPWAERIARMVTPQPALSLDDSQPV